ncbi:hypothetical protein L1049_021744 [Liquidambar formosana]|uniref:J domain-containing protein n=1 Tax=Liquidambar formosana TaxID=63359 RepID=A0AAP0WPZ3_LIQFO
MANSVGMASFNGSLWIQNHSFMVRKTMSRRRVCSCSYTSSSTKGSIVDQYKTLQIKPGASESEVKKAFRQLALQYHPDVCKGSNCGVQFHQINEAYDIVISNLRGEPTTGDLCNSYNDVAEDEPMRGMDDPDWDLWEEWMGWEGCRNPRLLISHQPLYLNLLSASTSFHSPLELSILQSWKVVEITISTNQSG